MSRSIAEIIREPLRNRFVDDQIFSLTKARIKHAPIHSCHEGYAVILEELDEVWEIVRSQFPNMAALRKELLHTAAMCQRMAEDLNLPVDNQ
jgi:hypothetical protein